MNCAPVAGIHRNTDHPHIHLLIHRTYFDRETRTERRLTRIPEEMLASRVKDENGAEKIHPGSFGQAFETALDRAQERARAERHSSEEAGQEKAATSDERLLEAARANPSLAGRELTQEIILRGPAREPDERPEATDLRAAFRTPSLDDPDYPRITYDSECPQYHDPFCGCPDDLDHIGDRCCQRPSPIIIDLNNDGYHLTNAVNGVNFDFNKDGIKERLS
ncbi:MAG: hypothetical protein ACREEM_27725 [Blastocatellia bacterium]